MKRVNLQQGFLVVALVATTAMSAVPVAARSVTRVARASAVSTTSLALPMNCPALTDPAGVQVMVDLDSVYLYKAANWTSPVVGRAVKFDCFNPVGRNTDSAWLLVPFGKTQAWLYAGSVRFKGEFSTLPDMNDVVSRSTIAATLPKGLPAASWRVRQMYLAAVKAGKNPNIFTVIGDCNSESAVYLGRFAQGGFDLSSFPALKTTALYFTKSFSRTSLATRGSFNAAMAFDSTWSDPEQCNADEGPLACELRVSKASILVIALGTGDQHDWSTFEANYRAIVDYTVKAGVLPVLMTKADALESQEGGAPADYINNVIRSVGAQYNVPVIDFWLATRSLTNNGLAEERNSAQQLTNPFHLNEEGMDMRILMTLQTLKTITYR
jgi:hypothetical protein